MTLTADSGSTIWDWILIDEDKGIIFKSRTKGIIPKLLNKRQITDIIEESAEIV